MCLLSNSIPIPAHYRKQMENWAKLLLLDQHQAFQLFQQIMQMIYECDFIPLCMCACVSFTESKLASWHCIPYPPPLGQHIQACVLQQTHSHHCEWKENRFQHSVLLSYTQVFIAAEGFVMFVCVCEPCAYLRSVILTDNFSF